MQPRTYTLQTHVNQHGFGVSVVVRDGDEIEGGFVLMTDQNETVRDEYVSGLAETTGWPVERHS